MAPNLFQYATKELSQDAFICWLLAWADQECKKEDETLHALSVSVVNELLEMHGVPPLGEPKPVKIYRQYIRADIVAEVADNFVFLIEDKVFAGLHGDQLVRYRQDIEQKFKHKRVLPIFLKTGDQSSYKDVEQAGYKLLLRRQFLGLLQPWRDRVSNAIFRDFLANLELRETKIESYSTVPVSVWTGEWDPWIGFYKLLQRELSGEVEWDYVSNASGGFLGAWWYSKEWADHDGKLHEVYLQIEQGPLCFKIAIKEEGADKADLRARWREQLATKAREIGIAVPKPARMGVGWTMTVGRIELRNWMAERTDRLLDVPATIKKLREAASVLDRATGGQKHLSTF
jgi:hypothetical protein